MKQYLDIAQDILDNGVWKKSARENMPATKSINSRMMKFDLSEGFPILTTKKMFIRGIIEELLWMLSGDTNIKYLVDKDIHIWDGDLYNYYLRKFNRLANGDHNIIPFTQEELFERIKKNNLSTVYGDLGKIYGYQWRRLEDKYGNSVDQVMNTIDLIDSNPNSRRIIIEGWNPVHFSNDYDAALPVCHKSMQFFVRGEYLDLNFYCRSQDFPLGTPFNISFYGILLTIFAKITGYTPGILTWMGGDIHIYYNQVEQMKVQLEREPFELPELKINFDFDKYRYDDGYAFDSMLLDLKYEDFELVNYEHHETLKFPLSQGV